MRPETTALFVLACAFAGLGCEQIKGLVGADEHAADGGAAEEKGEHGEGEHGEAEHGEDEHEAGDGGAGTSSGHDAHGHGGARRFGLPFAWERAGAEPLARTRSFLREMFDHNRAHTGRGAAVFEAYASAQHPRATVVACADSRVQASAFDATPEDDVFTIRNIGNQVANAVGSIEYGVEHLHTPLLIVLGHTGCGAVKAALGDQSELSEPIRRELAPLKLPPPKEGVEGDAAWTAAVVDNVHAQVAAALTRFAPFVAASELTVVGAVYDFRNDRGQGAGKVSIVDVNGITDPERIAAFVSAVSGGATDAPVRELARLHD